MQPIDMGLNDRNLWFQLIYDYLNTYLSAL